MRSRATQGYATGQLEGNAIEIAAFDARDAPVKSARMRPSRSPEPDSSTETSTPRTTVSHSSRIAWIVLVVILVGGIVAVGFLIAPYITRERIEFWVRDAGAWGPLVLLAMQVTQILVAPVPGLFVPVLAGLLYGPFVGALLTSAGSVIGSGAAYWIGRRGGRPVAERLLGPATLQKAHDLLRGGRWFALVPLFLIPLSPADALCFVAGIVAMDWRRFLLAVAIGRIPKDAIVAIGAALGGSALHP